MRGQLSRSSAHMSQRSASSVSSCRPARGGAPLPSASDPPPTSRECAVKLLPLTAAAQREASVGMRLPPHPNLVSTYSSELVDDLQLLVVMELARGRNVVYWLDRCGSFIEEEVRLVLRGITLGLHHLHSHGVAHRDIKCDNVIYDRGDSGSVKLCDLGFALPCSAVAVGGIGALALDFPGTCCYAAPEVVGPKAPYNPFLSDVWSLGVTAFVMLTATMPFGLRNDDQTRFNIRVHPFPTCSKALSARTGAAFDLLSGTLTKRATSRLSLDGVLRHPFLALSDDQLPPRVPALEELMVREQDDHILPTSTAKPQVAALSRSSIASSNSSAQPAAVARATPPVLQAPRAPVPSPAPPVARPSSRAPRQKSGLRRLLNKFLPQRGNESASGEVPAVVVTGESLLQLVVDRSPPSSRRSVPSTAEGSTTEHASGELSALHASNKGSAPLARAPTHTSQRRASAAPGQAAPISDEQIPKRTPLSRAGSQLAALTRSNKRATADQ